jgi:hypothetical protein
MTALFRVRVSGESMWPEFVSGKTYWASGFLRPGVGDAVVFRNPRNRQEIFVKRIVAESAEGYAVSSAVSWGRTSEEIGIVPRGAVLGRILRGFTARVFSRLL